MSPLKCLIVDDEPLARKLLAGYVEKVPGWEVAGLCKNAVEAYERLMQQPVNLLLLDINMPVISGLEFYRSLKDPPLLVFTTAYPEYAVEGFELEAVDYLVKPIVFERFMKMVQRVNALKTNPPAEGPEVPASVPVDYIFIKQDGKLRKLLLEDILYLEACKDFVRFVTGTERILAAMTMKEAGQLLEGAGFLRIHRSYVVGIHAITAVFGNTVEVGEVQLPIGGNFKEAVMACIQNKRG